MFRALLSLMWALVVACTELPPGDETPSGGAGGIGAAGGSGGTGAAGAQGALCSEVDLQPVGDSEGNDVFEGGVATGSVCSDGACSTGLDEVDRWTVLTCGGPHLVSLSWTNTDNTSDLDWAAFGPGESLVEESATRRFTGNLEEKTVMFEQEEALTVEVRAHSTSGLVRSYSLTVSRAD